MACVLLGWAACLGIAHAQQTLTPAELVLSRYTTTVSAPDANEDDPLAVIAHIQFPRSEVKTVSEAIRYLLLRTGYSLIDGEQIDPAVESVFSRPLPESHRQLGTYSVQAMLKVLMGKPFMLQVDPLHRTVSYVPDKEREEASVAQRSQP